LGEASTVEQAAALAGCSAPLIHHRAKKDPAVQAAVDAQGEELTAQIADALIQHNGKLAKVAKQLGMSSPQAVRYHVIRSPVLLEVWNEARENMVDTAEDNIFSAVEQGDLGYSWKVLQTLGKQRGYTERKEIDKTVVHSLDQATTGSLVGLLNKLASTHPDAVEAEFSELTDEERLVLGEAIEAEAAG
jgi:hypothetical protein|tara:strand:- start:1245 stop:1811 length:567 start_codon:yes stop_codon:yes gene_type:complete